MRKIFILNSKISWMKKKWRENRRISWWIYMNVFASSRVRKPIREMTFKTYARSLVRRSTKRYILVYIFLSFESIYAKGRNKTGFIIVFFTSVSLVIISRLRATTLLSQLQLILLFQISYYNTHYNYFIRIMANYS